jgi:phosphatidate cytidylyltransferase
VLRSRILTAAIGIPLLALILLAGQPWLTLLICGLVLGAALEAGGLLARAGYPVQPPLLALLALFGVVPVAALVSGRAELLLGAWLLGVVLVGAAASLLMAQSTDGLRRWLATVAGVVIVTMLAFLLRIALSAHANSASGELTSYLDAGRIWLLIVVLCVWAADTAAYALGRLWPRGHFFAHISPHKTWSGAAGGLAGATLAGLLLGLLIGQPAPALGLGVVVGIVGPIGDLAESLLKRSAGVKDSGRLFPGHGGLLDRVDALLVVAPAAWLYLVVTGIA